MRITVTGGAGFIGSHIARKLSEAGHEVTVADVKSTVAEDIPCVHVDLTDLRQTLRHLRDVECIVHLAGVLGVDRTEMQPVTTLDSNITMMRNVLEACRVGNVRKLLFASSSEVYGDPDKVPMTESFVPQPISTYGISKLVCEEYAKAYGKAYGLQYCILRYFNVYGTGQSEDFVIPRFVSLALRNKPLIIFGDGSQVRSFAYVSDIANGTQLAVERPNAVSEIINLGNDREPTTVKDLAQRILNLTGSRSPVQCVPLQATPRATREIHRRIPDIGKARAILGYSPQVSLEQGLLHVVSWLRESVKPGRLT